MNRWFLALFLSINAFTSYSQSYYCQYLIKPKDSSLSYNELDTAVTYKPPGYLSKIYANDFQTFMMNHFFYGSKIESYVFHDTIVEKVVSAYQQTIGSPVPNQKYVDSFRGARLKKLFPKLKGQGITKFSFHTTFTGTGLSQAFLYDKRHHKTITFYNNTDTGAVCERLGYVEFKKTNQHRKIRNWNCIAWIPDIPDAVLNGTSIKIWICADIPNTISFTDLGNAFPGGVVRIDCFRGKGKGGISYQLLSFKPIPYSRILFNRKMTCEGYLPQKYNFILSLIRDKFGIKLTQKVNLGLN